MIEEREKALILFETYWIQIELIVIILFVCWSIYEFYKL